MDIHADHHVYILASRKRGALYIGFTSDLGQRMEYHKEGIGSAHAFKYRIAKLVYFEGFASARRLLIVRDK